MVSKEVYDRLIPYAGICNLFVNCGEYVGGADGLVSIYEFEFATKVSTRCPGCFGAMLIDVHNKIKEYERNM